MKRLIVGISGASGVIYAIRLLEILKAASVNLLLRVADVVLKDRRPLIIVPRETPLQLGHLHMMIQVTEMGVILAPSLPAFYYQPQTLDEIINQMINRVLDLVDTELPNDLFTWWQGGSLYDSK